VAAIIVEDEGRASDRTCRAGGAPLGGHVACSRQRFTTLRERRLRMKIIGWIVLVIFLIGLAVVLGLGKLIF
jgi:hypothetical protein